MERRLSKIPLKVVHQVIHDISDRMIATYQNRLRRQIKDYAYRELHHFRS